MFATIELPTLGTHSALTVPSESVQTINRRQIVRDEKRLAAADPELRHLLAGPGLTREILEHSSRVAELAVRLSTHAPDRESGSDATGSIGVLARVLRPAMPERASQQLALGRRYRSSYGQVAGGGDLVSWSLAVPIADAGSGRQLGLYLPS